MSSVQDHYESFLAKHYIWMAGLPFDEKVKEQRALIETIVKESGAPGFFGLALDLGSGPGFQSIPLAQLGFSPVIAIDTCAELLKELAVRSDPYNIKTIEADLTDLPKIPIEEKATLALCMGDTLTHLPSRQQVQKLFTDVLDKLSKDGIFVITYRDLTSELIGIERFIPVRSDEEKVMICFLEFENTESVLVHALGFPAFPTSRWEDGFRSVRHLVGYEAIWWTAVILLIVHVLYIEKRPLTSLGFVRNTRADYLVGALGGIAILGGLAAIVLILFPLLHINEGPQLNQLTHAPIWWRLISVIRAAVGEEVLFRGYSISRLREISGSESFAAVLSWAIFTVEHVGIWGWGHLLIAGFGGAALTFLFVWRRNLWVSIIAHTIVDGVAVLS